MKDKYHYHVIIKIIEETGTKRERIEIIYEVKKGAKSTLNISEEKVKLKAKNEAYFSIRNKYSMDTIVLVEDCINDEELEERKNEAIDYIQNNWRLL